MNLQCHICGMKFRTMLAEAKHRHNFPMLCRYPRLTATQERAESRFVPGAILTARQTNERLSTLLALVRKRKLVELTNPGDTEITFSLTNTGNSTIRSTITGRDVSREKKEKK